MKKPSKLSFLVLGIGDLFTKFYYHTSMIIFADDFKLLVDFPSPLRKVIYEASKKAKFDIDVTDINDAILTHVHSDHSNGIETYGFYKLFFEGKKPTLYTIPEVKDVLWENRLKASMGYLTNKNFDFEKQMILEDYFNIQILEQGVTNKVGPFDVKIRRTKHFVPCFGFKISFDGQIIGYSSDTCFDPEHINFLSEADLIIHETNGEGHTPYNELLNLSEDIKKKLALIHILDTFDVKKSKLPVLEQGKIYSV